MKINFKQLRLFRKFFQGPPKNRRFQKTTSDFLNTKEREIVDIDLNLLIFAKQYSMKSKRNAVSLNTTKFFRKFWYAA